MSTYRNDLEHRTELARRTLANLAALAAAHAETDPDGAHAAATSAPRRDRSGRVLVSA